MKDKVKAVAVKTKLAAVTLDAVHAALNRQSVDPDEFTEDDSTLAGEIFTGGTLDMLRRRGLVENED